MSKGRKDCEGPEEARAEARLCAVGRYHHWAYWLDQPIVSQRGDELVLRHAALHGFAGPALCAQPTCRADAEAGRFVPGMRKELPGDGRRACEIGRASWRAM